MQPSKIKLIDKENLMIEWDNNDIYTYSLKLLRDESPDAGNKGETILWRHYEPAKNQEDRPGKYELADIKQIGHYGIKLIWKDGHDAGIYPWDLLIELGERQKKGS